MNSVQSRELQKIYRCKKFMAPRRTILLRKQMIRIAVSVAVLDFINLTTLIRIFAEEEKAYLEWAHA